jgi:hypothetical protein
LGDATDIVEVSRSLTELISTNERIGDLISNIGPTNRITAGLRTDLNAIEVGIPKGAELTDAEKNLIETVEKDFGAAVVFEEYEGIAVTHQDCNDVYCDPPLRGGNRIHNSGTFCTNAFVARSRLDDKLYQFTAGHCAVYGGQDVWFTRFVDGSAHNIGDVHNFRYGSSGDMAILHVNNEPGWDSENWVHVKAGDDTTEDEEYEITSTSYSVIGQRICFTGSVTPSSDCGTVTQLDVTVTYDNDGVTVRNLGKATYCGTNGDSGGPVYASHKAFGIHSGGATIDGACVHSYYQGIRGAENTMNVDVIF